MNVCSVCSAPLIAKWFCGIVNWGAETFATLGQKTTVMSPEVLVGLGIPCCRWCICFLLFLNDLRWFVWWLTEVWFCAWEQIGAECRGVRGYFSRILSQRFQPWWALSTVNLAEKPPFVCYISFWCIVYTIMPVQFMPVSIVFCSYLYGIGYVLNSRVASDFGTCNIHVVPNYY